MRDRKIKLFATISLMLLIGYFVFYLYYVLYGMLKFAFLEPTLMLNNRISQGYVTSEMRWIWFSMWIVPIGFGIYGALAAIYSFNMCRIGRYFDPKFGLGLMHLGCATVLGMATDVLGQSLLHKILTWAHPDGALAFAWRFNSEDLALILYGLGFFGIGLIIREAALIAEENKAFV